MRLQWPVPPDEVIKAEIRRHRRATSKEVLERYKFIWREFGPPMNMLMLGGMLAFFALEELRLCYIDGYYMSCILLAQIHIEDILANGYIIGGEEDVARQGFAKLIDKGLQDNIISPTQASQFHELRTMRNPYVHPRPGADKGTLMARFSEKSAQGIKGESHLEWLKDDAEKAIRIVVDFLRATTEYDELTQEIINHILKSSEDDS